MSKSSTASTPEYKLSSTQHKFLMEALREYTWSKTHPQLTLNKSIEDMPVVLAFPRDARTSVGRGLLKRYLGIYPKVKGGRKKRWYTLGSKGIEIVLHWVELGYSYKTLGNGVYPPRGSA